MATPTKLLPFALMSWVKSYCPLPAPYPPLQYSKVKRKKVSKDGNGSETVEGDEGDETYPWIQNMTGKLVAFLGAKTLRKRQSSSSPWYWALVTKSGLPKGI